jgi:hypothetical protein
MATENFWDTSWLFEEKGKRRGRKAPDSEASEGEGPGGEDPEREEGGAALLAEEVRSTRDAVSGFLPRGFRVEQVSILRDEARVIVTFPRGDADTLARSLRDALEDGWRLEELGSLGRQLWARLALSRARHNDTEADNPGARGERKSRR